MQLSIFEYVAKLPETIIICAWECGSWCYAHQLFAKLDSVALGKETVKGKHRNIFFNGSEFDSVADLENHINIYLSIE